MLEVLGSNPGLDLFSSQVKHFGELIVISRELRVYPLPAGTRFLPVPAGNGRVRVRTSRVRVGSDVFSRNLKWSNG